MDVLTFKIMGFDFTVELRQNVAINLDILTHMNINLEIDKTIKFYVSFNIFIYQILYTKRSHL